MAYTLLRDPASTIYAVHCTLYSDSLHCSGLYIAPNNPFSVIRLADSLATFDVELPPELVGSDQAIATWNVTLPLATTPHD